MEESLDVLMVQLQKLSADEERIAVLNKIKGIFLLGEEQGKKAERILLRLLKGGFESDKLFIYLFFLVTRLICPHDFSQGTLDELEEFEKDVRNKEFIAKADAVLEDLRRKTSTVGT